MSDEIVFQVVVMTDVGPYTFEVAEAVHDSDRARQIQHFCERTYAAGFTASGLAWYPPHRIHEIKWKETE